MSNLNSLNMFGLITHNYIDLMRNGACIFDPLICLVIFFEFGPDISWNSVQTLFIDETLINKPYGMFNPMCVQVFDLTKTDHLAANCFDQ